MNEPINQMWRPLGISAAVHLIVFVVLVLMPRLAPSRTFTPLVINVDLVAMPTAMPQSGGGEKTAKPSPPKKPKKEVAKKKETVKAKAEVTVAPKKAEVSTAKPKKKRRPKPKVKQSLKKKTYKPKKVVKKAIRKLEKKVARTEADPLAKTLAKLEQTVEKQAQQKAVPEKLPGKGTGTGMGQGRPGRQVLEKIDLYLVEIAFQVQRNWAYSEHMSRGRKELMALVAFKVMPDGRIDDVWFDQRSGDSYFDDSARKAVLKANPVPPHPEGIAQPFVKVGLRFTPGGIY